MLLEHGITLVINVKSVSVLIFLLFIKMTACKFICMCGRYTVFFDCLFLSCTIYIESTGMAALSLFNTGGSQARRKYN